VFLKGIGFIALISLALIGFRGGASSILPAVMKPERKVAAEISAYCPCSKCCGPFADRRTAVNWSAWNQTGVAADFDLIPKGTKIDIPGLGTRIVDDTGPWVRKFGPRGEIRLCVRFLTHKEAVEWGKKTLPVTIH